MENAIRFYGNASNAVNKMALNAEQVIAAFDKLAALKPWLFATSPGEWPDKFTLLNRYLRTGVKPPYAINS